jgi:hypothetical protein
VLMAMKRYLDLILESLFIKYETQLGANTNVEYISNHKSG